MEKFNESGPVAIHTRLGWVLSGPTTAGDQLTQSLSLIATHTLKIDSEPCSMNKLDQALRSFWDLESLEIINDDKSVLEDFVLLLLFRLLSSPILSYTIVLVSHAQFVLS